MPEVRRSWTATVIATIVGVGGILWFISVSDVDAESFDRSVFAVLSVWVSLALVHAVLTMAAFAGRGGEDLRHHTARVDPRRLKRRWWSDVPVLRSFMGSDDGPTWSVTLALCALIGVSMLLASRSVRWEGLFLTIGAALVVVSWFSVVIANALQYARMDLEAGPPDLAVPGDEDRSFADYLYFSLGVQATFGATDISVLTTRMRRIVSIHSLVAFVYNTVIVAIVVSVIVSGR